MLDVTPHGNIPQFEKVTELFIPLATKAIQESLVNLREIVRTVPPQPDRMRSGNLNTYVRGVGVYPKAAFMPDVAQPGGFKVGKTKKASIKYTSQQMTEPKSFDTTVETSGNEVHGTLKNKATYSGYVIGSRSEDPRQVSFHAETGWINKEDGLAQAQPDIDRNCQEAIDKLMAAIRGGQ